VVVRRLPKVAPHKLGQLQIPHAREQPVQMRLLEPLLVPPLILNPDQRHELDSALAQLLLSALQSSGRSDEEGGDDVVEDYT